MMVMAILAGMAVPQIAAGRDRARAVSAARHLAQLCQIARFQAVGSGRHVALLFSPDGDDWSTQLFADGNRNGVRAADIANRTDPPLRAPSRLSADFAGARIAVDPATGVGVDPVRLGGTTLLSFSPTGTATAGSIYVLGRDGTQLVVRVLGVTGRTRILRYEAATGTWEQP